MKTKTLTKIALAVAIAAVMCGCSHNPAMMTIGQQVKIGTAEYGELTYLNGFAIVDCSRENSGWRIEIDDAVGLGFDQTTKTLKGVKSITRFIGGQATGYLVDLAEASPEAAMLYVVNGTPTKIKDALEELSMQKTVKPSAKKEENENEKKPEVRKQ